MYRERSISYILLYNKLYVICTLYFYYYRETEQVESCMWCRDAFLGGVFYYPQHNYTEKEPVKRLLEKDVTMSFSL